MKLVSIILFLATQSTVFATTCFDNVVKAIPNQELESFSKGIPNGEALPASEDFSIQIRFPQGGIARRLNVDKKVFATGNEEILAEQYPKIAETFRQTGNLANNLTFDSLSLKLFTKRKIKKIPVDDNLKNAYDEAIDLLSNRQFISDYTAQLQSDVFQTMLNRGGRLADLAKEGKLDGRVVEEILMKRARDRGLDVVELTTGNTDSFMLFSSRFITYEHALNGVGNHGRFTHMIQLDMVLDRMSRVSGYSRERIMESFSQPLKEGSEKRVWDLLFDRRDGTDLTPENFYPDYLRRVLSVE